MEMTTTNEAVKQAFPDLVYEPVTVKCTDHIFPFSGLPPADSLFGPDGFMRITDRTGDEIVVVAEIIDHETILVGRRKS